MIEAADFCKTLLEQEYDYFTGVPCSFFKGVINFTQENSEMRYTIAANEGAAVGLAAGAYLAGRQPAVMIQNSGLGNMVNPLTSLSSIYKIPVLLISGRAYQVDDEPQHEIMGRGMTDLLRAMEIPVQEAPQGLEDFRKTIQEVTAKMRKEKRPYALIIKKGTISDYSLPVSPASPYPLSRLGAIEVLADFLDDTMVVVSTTGMSSRELFMVKDRPSNLYLMGSMGHAMAVACGVAGERTDRKVVILDGDGAVIMHMGSLSTIGHYHPENLIHIVLDNEAYETTGNQDTTSTTTHFAEIAEACGYAATKFCTDEASFRAALKEGFATPGPCLIHMKINRTRTDKVPRITTKHSAPEIAENFRSYLNESS